jgi:phage-related protein
VDWIGEKRSASHARSSPAGFWIRALQRADCVAAPGAYRAVYTVRFAHAVYVLHCFQKKSKRGIQTPKREIELIRERLKEAEMRVRGEKP